MRIMATSDLHGNLEGLDPRGADVVVRAGSGNQEETASFRILRTHPHWPPRRSRCRVMPRLQRLTPRRTLRHRIWAHMGGSVTDNAPHVTYCNM